MNQQQEQQRSADGRVRGLEEQHRNSYFYGKLLGVHNFELETAYGTGHRRQNNRLVTGYGVVCGLGVQVSDDGRKVIVKPGLGFDRRGRELVVERSLEVEIPPDVIDAARERAERDEDDHEACIGVMLCYHECRDDPAPVYAGDCGTPDPCAPSTIRERVRVEFRSRCPRRPDRECDPDLLDDGKLDYDQIVRWVTSQRPCMWVPADSCIPLAALRIADPDEHRCHPDRVDIGVRPIVFSNALLREIVLALFTRGHGHDHDYEVR